VVDGVSTIYVARYLFSARNSISKCHMSISGINSSERPRLERQAAAIPIPVCFIGVEMLRPRLGPTHHGSTRDQGF